MDADAPLDGTMSVEQLLDQAQARVERRQYSAASALIETALQSSPASVRAMLLQAACHLRLGNPDRALDSAAAAQRHAGAADLDAARRMHAECARAASERRLARARDALRNGAVEQAVVLLDSIATLRRDDHEFAAIRQYAQALIGRSRPLPGEALEPVLEWLTGEDLDEATVALADGDDVRATGVLKRVEAIDGRGRRAAYLRAWALCLRVVRELRSPDPRKLDAAEAALRRAANLAAHANARPDLEEQITRLRSAIEALEERVASANRAQRVAALVTRYNALVATYTGRPITLFEASNGRRSLASIGADVDKLRRRYGGESPEGRTLVELAAAITRLQQQLKRLI
jgi:hypothetical protein